MSWLKTAVCVLLAGALSVTVLAHGSGYTEMNGAVLTVLIGLTVGLALLFHRLLARAPADLRVGGALPLAAMSAVLAAALCYVLPISTDGFRRSGDLVLTGVAEHDPASKGSEVWATVRQSADGPIIAPTAMDGGWKPNEDKGVVLAAGAPASVRWKVRYDAGWELKLLKHPWSGFVDIDWLGVRKRVNLYAAGEGVLETIHLTGHPEPKPSDRWLSWLIRLSDLIVATGVIFLILRAIRSRLTLRR